MDKSIYGGFVGNTRFNNSGETPVLNFSLAVDKSYKDSNGKKVEKTKWVNCSLWGKRAESLNEYIRKGVFLVVEGETSSSVYLTTNDAGKREARSSLDLRVENLTLGGRGSGSSGPRDRMELPDEDEAPAKSKTPTRASSRTAGKSTRKGKAAKAPAAQAPVPVDEGDDIPFE